MPNSPSVPNPETRTDAVGPAIVPISVMWHEDLLLKKYLVSFEMETGV